MAHPNREDSIHTPYRGYDCFGWQGNKKRGLRIGIFFTIIAVLWLGRNMGWVGPGFFGPSVMIIIGIWIMIASFTKRHSNASERNCNDERNTKGIG
jgi:hypothetical protein